MMEVATNNFTEESQNSTEKVTHQFKFTGKAGEFFSIWIVNVLLSILTLGIYSAWAKVRTNSYFYGNMLLDDASFRYHAKPTQILKGRIIAFTLFVAYYFAGYVNITAAGITIGIISILMPAFIVMSFAFRMRNTSYRNVRFNFNKDYKKAYLIFLGPFILTAIYFYIMLQFQQDILQGGGQPSMSQNAIFQTLALPLLLFVLFPLFEYFLVQFRVNHSSYGTSQFCFAARKGSFYKIYIIAMTVFIAGIVLASLIGGMMVATLTSFIGNKSQAMSSLGMFIIMIPIMFLYFWLFAYIQCKKTNLILNSTSVKNHQLNSSLEVRKLVYLYFTNTFAIAFTIGLLAPWAMIRTARYKASCVTLISTESLDDFVATESVEQSAYGEEIGEMFDVDLGF